MLNDSDDDDWPDGGTLLGKVDKCGKAWPKWSFVMGASLSGAEISTAVVSNVQLGGVRCMSS